MLNIIYSESNFFHFPLGFIPDVEKKILSIKSSFNEH